MKHLRTIGKTICLAFSMYSRIPMPYLQYDEEDMRYTFLCFPFVGVMIGVLEYFWFVFATGIALTQGFYAAVATVIPIFVTGGFHMDGYIDTMDALSSHRERERKLEILKDSHVGAFAVIWSIVYFLLSYGAWQEANHMDKMVIVVVCCSFVLSRITSGLAAIILPSATGKHSLTSFAKAGDRKVVKVGLLCYMIAILVTLFVWEWRYGLVVLITLGMIVWYYAQMAKKQFGGITGDLAGWYLQMCELCILLITVVFTTLFS